MDVLHAPAGPTTADAPAGAVEEEVTVPRARLLVAVASAVAFVLGVVELGTDSFWVDDGFTLTHARLANADFFRVIVDHEMNGALFTTLMHGWVQIGQGETWMRLPSVLFATAVVPVTYLLARRLFDQRVGVTAAFLVAVNAFVVEYAHEARTYAMTLLLATSSVLLLVRYLQGPSRGRWAAWAGITALLPLAHFFGLLVVGAGGVAVVLRGRLPTPRKALVGGLAVVGLATLPIVWFLAAGGDKGQVDGAPALTPVRFVGTFVRLVGNGGPVLLLLAVAAIGAALWDAARRHRAAGGLDERTWGTVLLVSWVAVPIATMAVVSAVKPLFGARYFLLVAPGLIVLVAAGVWALPWRRAGVVLLGLIVAVSLVATAFFYPRDAHDDFRATTAYVLDHAAAGDAIVFQPWFTRTTFEVYAGRSPERRDQLIPLDPDPAWGDWLLIDQPPELTPERAEALLEGHDRIWVLERAGTEDAPQASDAATMTDALVANGYTAIDERSFPGLDVTLYQGG